jgi:4a-hydroxytetrahydrobiopterin dehydratase
MSQKLLTQKEKKQLTKKYASWVLSPNEKSLTRTFTFKDHVDALVFIARLTVHAQVLNHHPEIVYTYKKVKVSLTTHDAHGLTHSDLEYLKHIETIVHK